MLGATEPAQAPRRRAAARYRGWALAAALAHAGCFAPVAERCPSCVEIAPARPLRLPAQARRLFLLIPGLLGYGWEWNAAQIELARHPDTAVLVYSWDPWLGLARSGRQLAQLLGDLDHRLPDQIRDVTVIAHSAAGLVALQAAPDVRSPLSRPLRIVSLGAPLAGMGVNPVAAELRDTPLVMAIGGSFSGWRPPAPSVRFDIYPTGPDDPVMARTFGHDPGDARVLPSGTTLYRLPPELGHNNALGWLCQRLLDAAEAP